MNKDKLLIAIKEIGINISDSQFYQIEKFVQILQEENKKTNLTAIIDTESVYLKHIYDSLTISKIVDLKKPITLLDIGTGAGFPGMVLKIIFPDINVFLLDSNNKKTTFLKKVVKDLDLKKIVVINQRAEEYIEGKRAFFDIVTSRAVAPLNILSELSLPFVKLGGSFIAMKGNAQEELEDANAGIELLGGKVIKIENFKLPIEFSSRCLIKIDKIKNTPTVYPRGYDKIIKNPLKSINK